jgi:hypothetical protein
MKCRNMQGLPYIINKLNGYLVYLLVFHAYIYEMHGSRTKIPSKKSRQGFNSGVKWLKHVTWYHAAVAHKSVRSRKAVPMMLQWQREAWRSSVWNWSFGHGAFNYRNMTHRGLKPWLVLLVINNTFLCNFLFCFVGQNMHDNDDNGDGN